MPPPAQATTRHEHAGTAPGGGLVRLGQRRGSAYLTALVVTAVVVALRAALWPVLGDTAPLLLLLAAPVIAAYVGGFGPGVMATVVAAVVGEYLFVRPVGTILPDQTAEWVRLAVFCALGVLASWSIDARSRALAVLATEKGRLSDARSELARTEHVFRLLVENVRDYAIFALDPQGRVMTWNSGAERIKGYAADEIVGRSFEMFYPEADRRAGKPMRALEIARAEGRYAEEGIRVRKDGSAFDADVLIAPLVEEGVLVGYAKVTRDMTERKATEARLRALAQELEHRVAERTRELAEVNEELEAFCYSVSHDLRAPLRGMQGFALALEEDYAAALDPVAIDYIARITRASKRMEALVEDLLDYSRLSREELPRQPVALDRVVSDALARVASEVSAGGARVEVAPALPEVHGHHGTLVRVVANLVSNAVKFARPGEAPRVRVHADALGNMVRLWVTDNGIGIAPQHHERIFRVFERLHGIEAYPGTGIGLALVRKALERLGGRSGVESVPGEGSRFWIELPGAAAP